MNKETTVIWQEDCFPAQSSTIVRSEGELPTSLLFLEKKYEHFDGRKLKGRTVEGECVSVNKSVAFCIRNNTSIHNFDRANGEPIVAQEAFDEFQSYTTKLLIEDAFIGDVFVMQPNPVVSEVVYKSADLRWLSLMVPFHDEEPSVTLFENAFLSIIFSREDSESANLLYRGVNHSYALRFSFKSETLLGDAERIWVNSVVDLLVVILGGDIIPDDVIFYSKTLGAEFRRFGSLQNQRKPQFEPSVNKMVFPLRHLREELSQVIGVWMERPNTLRGVSALYRHARYREKLGEVSFSFAMRIAEAVYADPVILEEYEASATSCFPNGIIDLRDKEMGTVKKKLKEVSNSSKHPFAEKIRVVGERFDHVYRDCGAFVNWGACATECKDMRNAEAHGTLVGGQPTIEFNKLFSLAQMGLLAYELAVIDLFPLGVEDLNQVKKRLYSKQEHTITVADYWPF